MYRGLKLVLALSLAIPAVAQEQPSSPEVRRWSPVVSDLEEAIHLYRDILGFELGRVTTDDVDSYVFTVYNIDPSSTPRHAVFHSDMERRALSVVEVPGVSFLSDEKAVRPAATLINTNGRFDAIIAKLREEGYTVFEPHKLGEDGIEGAFLDRDGHLYALYEIPHNSSPDTATDR